jgi:virginiamycin A acetyltransferase
MNQKRRMKTNRFLKIIKRNISKLNLMKRYSHQQSENIVMEEGVDLAEGNKITCKTIIGKGTRIYGLLNVRGEGVLRIGRYVAIGEDLRVITSNHLVTRINMHGPLQRRLKFASVMGDAENVIIDHCSWVGDRVFMLPGSGVGIGSVIGGGSVVTKKFAPFSMIGGNPARMIKKRFNDEVIRFLLDLKWWEWSEAKMRANRYLFENDLTKANDISELKSLVVD